MSTYIEQSETQETSPKASSLGDTEDGIQKMGQYGKSISFQLDKAEALQKAVTVLGSLIEEGTFRFDQTGISLREMDSARICMVDIRISSENFSEIRQGQETKVSFKVDDLKKFLGLVDKDNSVWLSVSENFELETPDKKISVPVIQDWESSSPNLPPLTYGASVQLFAGDFQKALRDFSKVYENVELSLQGEFLMSMGDTLEGRLQESLEYLRTEGSGKAIYLISYLESAVKSIPKQTPVCIDFGDDIPVCISYEISEVQVKVFVAPRIED